MTEASTPRLRDCDWDPGSDAHECFLRAPDWQAYTYIRAKGVRRLVETLSLGRTSNMTPRVSASAVRWLGRGSRVALVRATATALVAMSVVAPVRGANGEDSWVQVTGLPDDIPTAGLQLDVGTQSFMITRRGGGGVTDFIATSPFEVTLRSANTCRVLVRDTFAPGTKHVLRLGPNLSVSVELWKDIDSGPSLGPTNSPSCPTLPSTDAVPDLSPEPSRGDPLLPMGVVVALLGAVGAWTRRGAGKGTPTPNEPLDEE